MRFIEVKGQTVRFLTDEPAVKNAAAAIGSILNRNHRCNVRVSGRFTAIGLDIPHHGWEDMEKRLIVAETLRELNETLGRCAGRC